MELRQLFLLWYTWVQLTSLIPIHSQINPVQILQIAFEFHFNIIILNIYSCPKRLLFWGIPAYKIFYFFFYKLLYLSYLICPSFSLVPPVFQVQIWSPGLHFQIPSVRVRT